MRRIRNVCMCAGLLTQFQMLGDSLMEASERQTQPTQHATLNKNTVAIMKCAAQLLYIIQKDSSVCGALVCCISTGGDQQLVHAVHTQHVHCIGLACAFFAEQGHCSAVGCMCRAVQKQFAEQEKATGGTPSLSVDVLTAAMTKREAARIFYQICGAPWLPRALSR